MLTRTPRLFRFIEDQYVNDALNGRFFLRQHSYYRSAECPEDRRDYMEGRAVQTIRQASTAKHGTEWLNRVSDFARFHECENITLSNITLSRSVPPSLIFCMTDRLGKELTSEGRNVAIEITDPRAFAKALVDCHPAEMPGVLFKRVSYMPRKLDVLDGNAFPDVFIKEEIYSHENEWRLAFPCRRNQNTFLTQCPTAGKLVRVLSKSEIDKVQSGVT